MKRLLCLLMIGVSTIFAQGLVPLFDGRGSRGVRPTRLNGRPGAWSNQAARH